MASDGGHIAAEAGIDRFEADVLPGDKAAAALRLSYGPYAATMFAWTASSAAFDE